MKKFLSLFLSLLLILSTFTFAEAGQSALLNEEITTVSAYSDNVIYLGTNQGNVYSFTETTGGTGTTTLLGNVGGAVKSMALSVAQSTLYIGVAGGQLYTLAVTPVATYGIFKAGGPIPGASTGNSTVITSSDLVPSIDLAMVQQVAGNTDVVAANAGSQNIVITESANNAVNATYDYAVIRKGAVSTWGIKAAGNVVVANGASNVVITPGVTITSKDLAIVQFSGTKVGSQVYVTTAVTGANNITATFNGPTDAVNTYKISFEVMGPARSFTSAGYIVAGGNATTTASTNGAAQNFTVSGILTTDIPIVKIMTSGDTMQITSASITSANILSVSFTADPSTTHQLVYEIIRRY